MPSSSRPTRLLLCALTLVALSGCASTAPRLVEFPNAPPLHPPAACNRLHPDALTELEEGYLVLDNEAKAREELRRKSEDGARYGALRRDYEACREWLDDNQLL